MFEHARKLALATCMVLPVSTALAQGKGETGNMPAAFADRLRAPPIAAPAMKIS